MTAEQQVLDIAKTNPFLTKDKIFGEDLKARMERFGLIVENAHNNWDLSDRDEVAVRTANALLLRNHAEAKLLRRIASLVEVKLRRLPNSCQNCTVKNYEEQMIEIRRILNEIPQENT